MQQPTTRVVNDALADIEAAERDPQHARSLARAAIKRWRSDADRQALPTVNRTTGSGAPLLKVDDVIRRSYPNHAKRKA